MNLTRKQWPHGWIPSDDSINGRPTGLLRMDNCYLDEKGVLSLVPGTQRVNSTPLSAVVHSLYSKYLGNIKHRFAGLGNGTVMLDTGSGNFDYQMLEAGHPEYATFATALGQILFTSGNKKRRFDGTNNYEIGMQRPEPPTLSVQSGSTFPIVTGPGAFNNATLVEGSNLNILSDGVQFDSGNNRGVVSIPAVVDTWHSNDGGEGTDEDIFHFNVLIGDTTNLVKVRVEIVLDSLTTPSEYYFAEWSNETSFNIGINAWTTLEIKRRQFERVGQDPTKDWSTVIGVIFSMETTTTIANNIINEFVFFGGSKGPLTGQYEYLQINVNDTGTYKGKSAASNISEVIETRSSKVTITPYLPVDPQVNEIWIYRRSAESNTDVTRIGDPRKLDQFYRIKTITNFIPFNDEVSDDDALLEGQIIDFHLASIQGIEAYILGITDLVYDRVFYLTEKDVYISSSLDLDSYNPLHVLHLSGNTFERNLWISKVGEGRILVGTTEDIYEISGTFRELPDFTIDANIRPLGLGFAPISRSFAVSNGMVYYISADGWRVTNGSDTKLLLGDLDLLFRGKDRYGISPVAILPQGLAIYACAVYRDELWTYTNFKDGTRAGLVYDFINNIWRYHKIEAVSLFVEEDGILIAGFGGGSGNYVHVLDTGNSLSGINGQDLHVLTVFDDNGQPRNRKDVFTLKFTADTGGKNVDVQIAKDGGSFTSLGNHNSTGISTSFYALNLIGLGFRYALRVLGTDLNDFKLYEFDIEYDPRPEQVNYLRIPPTNLGTISRKRFPNYAFVIDTLGNTITFTPYVDNIVGTPSAFVRNYKGTFIHFFTTEVIGIDIGGILSGGIFEFYQVNLEEIVSEKLPTPTKYLVIPANDYGNPNRKRHSSYKFQINTRGANVNFTPRLDGVNKTISIVNTSEKRTHEHFFISDTIGIDIGGILETLADTEFEFYGPIIPQQLEVLPPRLKELYVPENNLGIPAKKRVRTLPMGINTNGYNVTFTPILDGIANTPSTINTSVKRTAFHYFTTDVFFTDVAGEFIGTQPFEFYGFLQPEAVEVLPVGKKFDQIGPVSYERIGKFLGFRIRIISGDSTLPYNIYKEDVSVYTGTINTLANIDMVYEVMQLPKTIVGTTFRIELGPTANPFHRYWLEMKVNISGAETESKWVRIK